MISETRGERLLINDSYHIKYFRELIVTIVTRPMFREEYVQNHVANKLAVNLTLAW